MGGRLIASDSGAGALYSLSALGIRRAPLSGAAALCAGGESVFCASRREDVIWRLDARTLCPQQLFAGGPNVTRLLLSPDGGTLYALCQDADSVLMLESRTGAPLMLARAGQQPRGMALDPSGRCLAVAGGGRCEVQLLNATTLRTTGRAVLPGPVTDVAFSAGMLYALCLAGENASRVYALRARNGAASWNVALSGLPGGLCPVRGGVLAGTDGVSRVSRGEPVWRAPMEGLCERVLLAGERVVCADALQGGVYAVSPRTGESRRILDASADDLLWYTDAPSGQG